MNQHQLDEVLSLLDDQLAHQEDVLLGPVSRLLDASDSSLQYTESQLNRVRGRAARRAGLRVGAQEELLRGPLSRLEGVIHSGIDDRDTALALAQARATVRTSEAGGGGAGSPPDTGDTASMLLPPAGPDLTPAVNGGGGLPPSLLEQLESILPPVGTPDRPEPLGPPAVADGAPPAVCPGAGPTTPTMPLSIGGIVCPAPPLSPLTPVPLPVLLPQLLPVLPGPVGGLLGPVLPTIVNQIQNLFLSPISLTLSPPSVTVSLSQILSQIVNLVPAPTQPALVSVVNNLPPSQLNSLITVTLGPGVPGAGTGPGPGGGLGPTAEACPPEGCPQCGGDIGPKVREGQAIYVVPWGVHQGTSAYYGSECARRQIHDSYAGRDSVGEFLLWRANPDRYLVPG